MVTYAYNTNTWDVEPGGLRARGTSLGTKEFEVSLSYMKTTQKR